MRTFQIDLRSVLVQKGHIKGDVKAKLFNVRQRPTKQLSKVNAILVRRDECSHASRAPKENTHG